MRYPNGMTAKEWSDLHVEVVDPVGIVQQQFKSEMDINTILRRFHVTGAAPLGVAEPMYGDFTGIEDWESAVEKVEKARADFMALPPEVRERFGNNPGGLIEYARGHTYEEFVSEMEAVDRRWLASQPPDGSSSAATKEAVE